MTRTAALIFAQSCIDDQPAQFASPSEQVLIEVAVLKQAFEFARRCWVKMRAEPVDRNR